LLCSRIERMFPRQQSNRVCFFPGCDRRVYGKGLCQAHYAPQRRTGSLQPLGSRRRTRGECGFEGCDKLAVAKGLCQSHHKQRKKGQALRPLRPFYGTKGPCRFDGCSKPRASGWLLRRTRCTVLQWPATRPALSAEGGLQLSWLHEASFRARLLPGSLAPAAGEASAHTAS
jgi:hypothetical protein